ncbi:hypothetical protein ACFLRI_00995 [Bacteroidota bacterium]
MDFTLTEYKKLLYSLQTLGFLFQPFEEFVKTKPFKGIVLRHDVDLLPQNSLKFAQIQHEMGIHTTYYFRIVSESFNEGIIKEIMNLGHEIGYHYETMDTAFAKYKVKIGIERKSRFSWSEKSKVEKGTDEYEQLLDLAYEEFCINLESFRKFYPVTTVCMHGSPRSEYDNKDIWKKYAYKSLGIIGEPYYDVDFNEVFYLTDTGRRWDGYKVSVRDRIPVHQERWNKEGLVFHSTQDIINAINSNKFPNKVMLTFHPQRWNDKPLPWAKELIFQNAKNLVKYFIVKSIL